MDTHGRPIRCLRPQHYPCATRSSWTLLLPVAQRSPTLPVLSSPRPSTPAQQRQLGTARLGHTCYCHAVEKVFSQNDHCHIGKTKKQGATLVTTCCKTPHSVHSFATKLISKNSPELGKAHNRSCSSDCTPRAKTQHGMLVSKTLTRWHNLRNATAAAGLFAHRALEKTLARI